MLPPQKARQPFDAICVVACSTIAVGSGISISSTPIRIIPPAMPNRPTGRLSRPSTHRGLRSSTASPESPASAGSGVDGLAPIQPVNTLSSASLVAAAQTELSCSGISFLRVMCGGCSFSTASRRSKPRQGPAALRRPAPSSTSPPPRSAGWCTCWRNGSGSRCSSARPTASSPRRRAAPIRAG